MPVFASMHRLTHGGECRHRDVVGARAISTGISSRAAGGEPTRPMQPIGIWDSPGYVADDSHCADARFGQSAYLAFRRRRDRVGGLDYWENPASKGKRCLRCLGGSDAASFARHLESFLRHAVDADRVRSVEGIDRMAAIVVAGCIALLFVPTSLGHALWVQVSPQELAGGSVQWVATPLAVGGDPVFADLCRVGPHCSFMSSRTRIQ